jgi:hypothetical protein
MTGPLVAGFFMLSWIGFFVGFVLRVDSSRNWFAHISGAAAMSLLYGLVPLVPLSRVLTSKRENLRPAGRRLLLISQAYLGGLTLLTVVVIVLRFSGA